MMLCQHALLLLLSSAASAAAGFKPRLSRNCQYSCGLSSACKCKKNSENVILLSFDGCTGYNGVVVLRFVRGSALYAP